MPSTAYRSHRSSVEISSGEAKSATESGSAAESAAQSCSGSSQMLALRRSQSTDDSAKVLSPHNVFGSNMYGRKHGVH